MAIVNLSDLKEGMVVAEPIVIQGNVLLEKGKTLTIKVIHVLKAWGISGVNVVGKVSAQEESFASEISSEELDEIKTAVEYRLYGFSDEDETMSEVKRIMIKRNVQESIDKQEEETQKPD